MRLNLQGLSRKR